MITIPLIVTAAVPLASQNGAETELFVLRNSVILRMGLHALRFRPAPRFLPYAITTVFAMLRLNVALVPRNARAAGMESFARQKNANRQTLLSAMATVTTSRRLARPTQIAWMWILAPRMFA